MVSYSFGDLSFGYNDFVAFVKCSNENGTDHDEVRSNDLLAN